MRKAVPSNVSDVVAKRRSVMQIKNKSFNEKKKIVGTLDILDSPGLAMKGESTLKLFLFQALAVSVFFAEVKADPTFSRSSYFTARENKQLKGYVVKRFDSPSLLLCGQQCMRNAWCSSTNYKMSSKKDGKGTCELNKHDISLIDENLNLQDHKGVTFSMLLKVNFKCHFSDCCSVFERLLKIQKNGVRVRV